jgi:hypothetical protein
VSECIAVKVADTGRGEQDEHSSKSVFDTDEDIAESFLLKEIRNQYSENEEDNKGDPASFSFVSIGFSLFEVTKKDDGDEEASNGFSEE